MARTSKLPVSPQQMTLNVLRESRVPMSAYNILEQLQPMGVKSPPIIYRALDALEKQGAVHKIDAQNAYVACDCTHSHKHDLTVLTICQQCGAVDELHDKNIMQHVLALKKLGVNLPENSTVQLPVLCDKCKI